MPPLVQGDGFAIRALVERDRIYFCWLWQGCLDRDGYGKYPDQRGRMAHRLVYEWLVGPATGKELDHVCRRRNCVSPAHLEPVTHQQNMLRVGRGGWRRRSRITECPKGHDFFKNGRRTPEGGRICLVCSKEWIP